MISWTWLLAATVMLTAVLIASGASAQTEGLSSNDPQELASAIEAVGEEGDRRAVAALRDRLRQGLPPELLEKAITALGQVQRSDAVTALAELTRYRRPTVRVAVAQALGATGVRAASSHLARMLDDPSAPVRAAAAQALGELDARGAMGDLLRAARRGVLQAAAVIGRTSRPAQARAVLREVNAESLDALAPALEQIVTRQDMPAHVKRTVVRKLGELGTARAEQLLQDLIASLPDDDRIRQEATETLEQMREAAREEESSDEPPEAERPDQPRAGAGGGA